MNDDDSSTMIITGFNEQNREGKKERKEIVKGRNGVKLGEMLNGASFEVTQTKRKERKNKQTNASVVFECVATCPIFCHTTITLHKMYLIILNIIVGSVLMIVNNAVPTVPADAG
ncbi:hypothetical protein WN55_02140 [Dufourea novaeangliae]|uniref:Uncharacterized protein n=1 Tax=Dufourea novaeangliae TaxID=178035 RepID=A0A154NXE8_DUFNO|nr:hypothetical protein WN55_02140 [Dufourea novaeangliae]